jgi:hypothetical protein
VYIHHVDELCLKIYSPSIEPVISFKGYIFLLLLHFNYNSMKCFYIVAIILIKYGFCIYILSFFAPVIHKLLSCTSYDRWVKFGSPFSCTVIWHYAFRRTEIILARLDKSKHFGIVLHRQVVNVSNYIIGFSWIAYNFLCSVLTEHGQNLIPFLYSCFIFKLWLFIWIFYIIEHSVFDLWGPYEFCLSLFLCSGQKEPWVSKG